MNYNESGPVCRKKNAVSPVGRSAVLALTSATSMLAFDIETTGLDPLKHDITVAAVCNREAGIRECYNFIQDGEKAKKAFIQRLDDAQHLCAFNGARFDLPFIVHRFQVPRHQYEPWFLKLFDYFEVGKLLFDSHFSLNKLLQTNRRNPKTGSGRQAIVWAQEKRFKELMEYCQDDADLTYDISVAEQVSLPLAYRAPVMAVRVRHDPHRFTFEGEI